jgi:hypothetical protein
MTSIASRSLTVTDPRPNETHLTKPNRTYRSQILTNHVRVNVAHDREHGCQDSFTLYRGCTHSTWVVIIHCSWIPIVRMEYPYTLLRCALGNHNKAFQWFHLAYNVPTEVSPLVWASHPTRSPLLCIMGFSHHSFTHTFPRFNHRSFTTHPSGFAITAFSHIRLVRQD